MKKDYWLERWERRETGFHQDEINPYLRQYWHELHVARGGAVFVPLCGKSLDMLWLREQGHPVLGVELSGVAVQDFFRENGYTPQCTANKNFNCSDAAGMRILCGDFFDLTRNELAEIAAVYDRASLVALPPHMRERYVRHLAGILPPATKILLVTFDYPQAQMPGPPFAVSAIEVETLYREHADICLLGKQDVLAQNPRFQQRGLDSLHENIYLLTLR